MGPNRSVSWRLSCNVVIKPCQIILMKCGFFFLFSGKKQLSIFIWRCGSNSELPAILDSNNDFQLAFLLATIVMSWIRKSWTENIENHLGTLVYRKVISDKKGTHVRRSIWGLGTELSGSVLSGTHVVYSRLRNKHRATLIDLKKKWRIKRINKK